MNNNYDNHIDDHVEDEIQQCFSMGNLKCFFTFSGAGSGKTRSLVNTLNYLKENHGDRLLKEGKNIVVITYTNVACEEIKARIGYNELFQVSTIHSFLWDLIKSYQMDIKAWFKSTLKEDIEELKKQEAESTRSSKARIEKIDSKNKKLKSLEKISRFSYNPNGQNTSKQSLNHSEVIKIASDLIENKILLQKIIIAKYPVLLIDESQDTKKELITALLSLYNNNKGKISIGMFGDSMQKIYTDGQSNLSELIPNMWVKPVKQMNHRSSKRIVTLANSIRKNVDSIEQRYRSDVDEGHAYLFIKENSVDKNKFEKNVCEKMKELTNDKEWLGENSSKKLILEHHMAASRLHFLEFFSPLYNNSYFKEGILKGNLEEIKLFTDIIIPICDHFNKNNQFLVSTMVKKYSPLLERENLKSSPEQLKILRLVSTYIENIVSITNDDTSTGMDIIKKIKETGVFNLPQKLKEICEYDNSEDINDEKLKILFDAFSSNYNQIKVYSQYISEKTCFSTQQGVKGLEFPRVTVIMDDSESRGFLFSYEKLFGAKELTDKDISNMNQDLDSSLTRTTRLFYVACTRAKESLAIIAYTEDVEKVKATALKNRWFNDSEIICL